MSRELQIIIEALKMTSSDLGADGTENSEQLMRALDLLCSNIELLRENAFCVDEMHGKHESSE